jgi:hypothetical protein
MRVVGDPYAICHLLFECDRTRGHAVVVCIEQRAKAMVLRICEPILEANQRPMNNIAGTGYVDNNDAAVSDARRLAQNYTWGCTPGCVMV